MNPQFLTPKEIMETVSGVSQTKLLLHWSKLLVLGVLAGAYIALGAHFTTTITTGIQDYVGFGLTKLIGGAVFSMGLMLVVIAGAELFTGNMMHVIGLWQGKTSIPTILKSWGMVWLANLIGAMIVVGLVYFSGLNGSELSLTAVGKTAVSVATTKSSLPFLQVFVRAILANWLVCLAVMLAISARDIVSKMLGIFFPIMAFVAMSFEHSIANMYFLPAGMLLSPAISINGVVINLTASTLGNMVGGIFFVWTAYWFVYLNHSQPAEVNQKVGLHVGHLLQFKKQPVS